MQDFNHDLPEDDDELNIVYNANKDHILADHIGARGVNTYNFPIQDISENGAEFEEHLNKISKTESGSFKINVALGVIMQDI